MSESEVNRGKVSLDQYTVSGSHLGGDRRGGDIGVTGRTMLDDRRTSPDQTVAASIQSGETYKGDVITIRATTPYW